jgi:dihydroxyacetone kinase-like protein
MFVSQFLDAADQMHDALTRWDQVAGDGDFGDNLCHGLRGAVDRAAAASGLSDELTVLGEWFLDEVGGSSGPLLGLLFTSMARAVVEASDDVDRRLVDGIAAGVDAIMRVGGAERGDRTMLDALIPGVEQAREPGAAVDWAGAAQEALAGARETSQMRARAGRASYVGDRAIGSPDAGAMGIALMFWALAVERDPGSQARLTPPRDMALGAS